MLNVSDVLCIGMHCDYRPCATQKYITHTLQKRTSNFRIYHCRNKIQIRFDFSSLFFYEPVIDEFGDDTRVGLDVNFLFVIGEEKA